MSVCMLRPAYGAAVALTDVVFYMVLNCMRLLVYLYEPLQVCLPDQLTAQPPAACNI